MPFTLKDRVKDTTATTGTGTVTLSGSAPSEFQAFSSIGNGNSCAYVIAGGGQWETGIGTYSSSGPTLSRDTVLDGSSGPGAPVNFSAGSKDVFVTVPAALVGWQQIGATQTPSGVASSSITGIPDRFSDLMLEYLGLSHDNGSGVPLRIELSGDNGSTWTAPANLTGNFTNNIVAYGQSIIAGYRRAAGGVRTSAANITSDGSVGTGGEINIGWRIAAGISALRLSYGGGNFDGGSWKLWGRL